MTTAPLPSNRTHSSAGRVLVVTNGNYFSAHGLSHILRWGSLHANLRVIVTTGLRRPNRSPLAEAYRLLRVWGLRYGIYKLATYAVPALSELLSRQPRFVASTCHALGVPVTVAKNVNTPDVRRDIQQYAPDVIVSFSCPYRIKPDVLSLARVGALNVHSSLLPAYAGVCTYIHVLAEGADATGVTVHEMVESFDAGRIVSQRRIAIPPETSAAALFLAQCRAAAPLLRDAVLMLLSSGAINGIGQNPNERTYRSEPRHDDICALFARGHRLIRSDELFLLTMCPLPNDDVARCTAKIKALAQLGYQDL